MNETRVRRGAGHETITGAATVLAAAVLAALFLLPSPFAFGTAINAGQGPTGSAHVLVTPTVASDPQLATQLQASLIAGGHPGDAERVPELPLSTVERFLEVNANPNSSTSDVWTADQAAFTIAPAFDWGQLLGAAVGGCVAGAVVGGLIGAAAAGIGALPGAGIGCVAGAAAGALGDALGQSFNHATNTESFQVADAEAANELRLVLGEVSAVDAILPATNYFWGRLADVAAEQQIGNSTFNAYLDLNVSTIVSQLGTIANTVLAEMDSVVQLWIQFAQANGHPLKFLNGGAIPATYVPFGVRPALANSYLVVPSSGLAINAYYPGTVGGGACSGSPFSLSGWASTPTTTPSWAGCSSDPQQDANYTLFSVSGGPAVVTGLQANSQETHTWLSAGAPFCPAVSSCAFTVSLLGEDIYDSVSGGSIQLGCYAGSYVCLANASALFNETAGLEFNAVQTGETYWTYLRDLGYTNPSAIPVQFAILPPALALPDDLCIDNSSIYGGTTYTGTCANLNSTEAMSLYLAELQSMARFFNSTTYQKGPVPCIANCTDWGNLNTVAVGAVYIPNGTPQNASDHTEVFSTPATWSYVGKQLLLFPQLNAVTIPVNRTWEVPSSAPLMVGVLGVGSGSLVLLQLTGNGTANGTYATHATAGNALFLGSCAENGVATKNCSAQVYTVNVTAVQLLCSANSSACPTPPSGGGGLTVGGVVCGFLGFFGLPCTGIFATIGELLLLVVAVVVVGLVLYVLYRLASAGGGRSRGVASPLFLSRATGPRPRRFRRRNSRGALEVHHAIVLGLGVVFAGAGVYAFYLSEERLTGTSLGLFILGALFVFGALTFAYLEDR
ncbi:MAG: hypothetical protein WBG19_00300 [Thermoplasmata archaeon]